MNTATHRIYAIGDIHGCRDEFAQMRAAIAADLAAHPHPNPLAITLGDYVDRGPDSAGVMDDLIAWHAGPLRVISLRGNHDIFPAQYLHAPQTAGLPHLHWLDPRLGGDKTLRSYGVEGANPDAPIASHKAARSALPDHHLNFIANTCRLTHQIGDYLFVHAGIHPDNPLDDQDETDLIWIREPFLSHTGSFGATVIHGHTPVHEVEDHGNRIAIDTGCVFGRHLSCVVVEDARIHLLQPALHKGRTKLR